MDFRQKSAQLQFLRGAKIKFIECSSDLRRYSFVYATDLFRMGKDGHTHEAIQRKFNEKFNVKLPDECGHLLPYETDL